jgi:ankyrin repeat protein
MDRLEEVFARTPPPTPREVTEALWQACHGGQRQAAEYLLDRGADLNWVPGWDQHTPLDMAQASGAEDLVEWLQGQGARSADQPR